MEKEKKCKDMVKAHATTRTADIRELMAIDHGQRGEEMQENGSPELGRLNEYGLSFDYVAPGTFTDQRRGYFRYQISYGGPSEEYRFFTDENLNPVRIEFWYLDWFDGAKVLLKGQDLETMLEWFNDLKDCESVKGAYDKAMAE